MGHQLSEDTKKGCIDGVEKSIKEFLRRTYDIAFKKLNYLYDHPSEFSEQENEVKET